MKKYFLLTLTLLLVLTGCGKKISKVECTINMEEDGIKATVKDIFEYGSDNKITSSKRVYIYENKTITDEMCSTFESYYPEKVNLIECDDTSLTIKDLDKLVDNNDDNGIVGTPKDDIISLEQALGYTCK